MSSYENPFAIGYEILKSDSPVYSVMSHGDLGATFESMANSDLPRYTSRFYAPTEFEQFSDVKYSKIEIGYEKDMKEIHDAIKGVPLEFYTPRSVEVLGGGVSLPKLKTIGKEDAGEDIKREIEKAQQDALDIELVREIMVERIRVKNRFSLRKVLRRRKP
tara:strand:- start:94 stop:576 length:483 start_codon:yes stop_codon:yes gene_type:complete